MLKTIFQDRMDLEDDTEQLMMVRMAEGSTETWQQMEQVREQQQLV